MAGVPPTRSSLLALCVCLAASFAVFVGGLGGRAGVGPDGSVLSFDPAHPFFPRPWVGLAAAAADDDARDAPRDAEPDARPDGAADPARADARPPINPITSDIDFFVLPGLRRFEQLAPSPARGEWDPGQLLGYPLRANLPYPLHSPLWRALRGLPAETRLGFALWLHTALAGWLAWRAARALGADAAPAWLAAAGTALSFWMTTRWHLPQVACAAVWWGGLVVAVEHVRARRVLRGAAEFGLWGGLALSSGFPQVALLLIAGAGLWSLVRGAGVRAPVAWRDRVLGLGGGLALALLVGAPELGAVASVYEGAARTSEASQAAALEHGLQPGALFGALLPRFFGHPPDFAAEDPPAPRMSDLLPARRLLSDDIQDNVVENALFPGVVVLLLLPLAWAAGGVARRLLLFALGWIALALVFSWLADVLPLLRPLGTGSIKRVLVLSAVCLPLAAALGWQALLVRRARGVPRASGGDGVASGDETSHAAGLESRAVPRAAALVGAALLLAASAPLWFDDPDAAAWRARLWPHAAGCLGVLALAALLLRLGMTRVAPRAALVLLAALELALLGRAFNPFTSAAERFPSTPGLRALAASPGRVAVFGDATLLPPSATALHGLRSVHGVAPLVDARTVELLECVEPGLVDVRDPRVVQPFRDPLSLEHPLLDLLGVGRVVTDEPGLVLRSGLPLVGEFPDEGFGVLARTDTPQLASFVTAARVVPDAEQRLALLRDPTAPWREAALLEEPPAVSLPERGETRPARVLDEGPGMWHVDVDGEGAGLVLIAESWHPGWRALVDGRRVPVLRAQHALMAVAVPDGSRRVSLLFKQPGWPETRHLAWLGWIGTLVLGAWGLRRSRAASTR